MNDIKIIMLSAYTSRSQAYIQAMINAGISLDTIISFGQEKNQLPGQINDNFECQNLGSIFIPDLSIPLSHSITSLGCHEVKLNVTDINDKSVYLAVKKENPDYVIFSGYGGQLVGEELLNLEIPFLHMHSGWLPEYRGSTTIYYSILNGEELGVSAIILKSMIDQGNIIKRKKYPLPTNNLNIDYIYDSAIRADLLIDLLKELIEHKQLPELILQKEEDGSDYYVIHPLLKHIAILSHEDN